MPLLAIARRWLDPRSLITSNLGAVAHAASSIIAQPLQNQCYTTITGYLFVLSSLLSLMTERSVFNHCQSHHY